MHLPCFLCSDIRCILVWHLPFERLLWQLLDFCARNTIVTQPVALYVSDAFLLMKANQWECAQKVAYASLVKVKSDFMMILHLAPRQSRANHISRERERRTKDKRRTDLCF